MLVASVVLGLAAATSASTTRRFILNAYQPNTTCTGALSANAKRLVTDYYEVVDGNSCYNTYKMGTCTETFKADPNIKMCNLILAGGSRSHIIEKDTTGAERLRVSTFSSVNCTGFPALSVVFPLNNACYNATKGSNAMVALKELGPAGVTPAKDGLLVNTIGQGACPATGAVTSKAPVGLCVPFVESQLSIPNLYPNNAAAASGSAAKTYVIESFDGSAGVIVQHYVDKDCTIPYFDNAASSADITAQTFAYYFPYNTCMEFKTTSNGQSYTWNQKFAHEDGTWTGSVGGSKSSGAHRNIAPTTGTMVTVLIAFVASMML
eukprot:comp24512_c0_seq1/m.46762 comp24512_c0_seq1/g.46762  ORF comp24512_c0_seq1/g.46762 comp24512_c0_seq1/m.46762 type:complete len:321 (-) comp24512_c0_seq1:515-1477(-)